MANEIKDIQHNIQKNRSLYLDCLRGIAILMVLLCHSALQHNISELDPVSRFFRQFGMFGVDIFFPLSGFLITGFLLERNKIDDIKVFFSRRFFRIFPLYIVAIITFVVASFVTKIDLEIISSIWKNVLFLTGWFIFIDGFNTVPYTITWSLSVEEFCYIIFGISAYFSKHWFKYVIYSFILLSLATRYYVHLNEYKHVYYFPMARIDSVAIGSLLAFYKFERGSYPIFISIGLFLILIVTLLTHELANAVLLYTTISVGTIAAISVIQNVPEYRENIILKYLSKIGFYSYFIYLFHFFNIYALKYAIDYLNIRGFPFWVFSLCVLLLTYIQALISFQFFEGPLMALGRTWERKWRS